MKESRKDNSKTWTKDPGLATRYAPIHDMVNEIFARIEPDGYAQLVEELRAEWNPVGVEVQIVEFMAEIACRIRGCLYLDTEIMRKGMEACAGPDVTPDVAQGLAYIRDCEGPKLLDKLSRYQSRLSKEFSRCIRILQLGAKNRKYAETRIDATLAKTKPCTSVIQ